MRKFLSIFFCAISFVAFAQESAQDSVSVTQTMQITSPEDLIARASIAYEQGDYKLAISDYESLTEIYRQAPDLYYNLGNAYFKDKNFAKAILNYERCLIHEPNNDDARANLELAQTNCVDKIESIQPVIFKTWSDGIRNLFSCKTWTYMAIGFFFLFAACLYLYFFQRKVFIRKTGFYLGIVAIIISLICNVYANQQKDRIVIRDYAIVISPSVTVKSSPADSGTQLFTIHEGLKVKVRTTLSGWTEIELSDGNVGWLPSNAVEVI